MTDTELYARINALSPEEKKKTLVFLLADMDDGSLEDALRDLSEEERERLGGSCDIVSMALDEESED